MATHCGRPVATRVSFDFDGQACRVAELADHLRHGRLVRGGAGDQHLTGAVRHPSRAQPGAHGASDGGGQQADAGAGGQHGAVLRHDRVDMVPGIGEHSLQFAHDPPGDHDHPDLPGASLGQRGEGVRPDPAVSEGAVIVDRYCPEIGRRPRGHARHLPIVTQCVERRR
jgi:hypothetical protein